MIEIKKYEWLTSMTPRCAIGHFTVRFKQQLVSSIEIWRVMICAHDLTSCRHIGTIPFSWSTVLGKLQPERESSVSLREGGEFSLQNCQMPRQTDVRQRDTCAGAVP